MGHYDDASHGVHLESTVQRGPSLSCNFTKNPSKYKIKICQMGRWWSNLVKGVKIWQYGGRFHKKNRLESLLQKEEENNLPPLRWHRRWKWTRLSTESQITATWQHARILNVWGRGRGTFLLASKHEMALKLQKNYRKVFGKLLKTIWKSMMK